ncbi:kinase-like protein, partial [Punctularia strigosozonata HHB-11173 SS5]|uniref:kinase-like protein n=1 Tax=Punctularia strigosozonata (strain HHB-11173) TaxID=741275 RepID=UPI000441667E
MLPSGLFVNGVQLYSRDAVDAGGFGDIFQGSYHGQEVALKRFRIFSRDRVIIHRRIYRELLLWQTLNHPNVLPFIGVDASSFESMICAVSPWMHGGSLSNYRARFEPTPSDINALLLEAALGMDYLHSLSIVHGDLRCTNILVDRDGHAKLADFGLSVIIIGEMGTATTSNGSYRWAAPELFATGDVHRTVQSDVYAFGCVCLEAHTGLPPFAEIANEFKVVLQLTSGARPCRPDYNQSRLVSEHLWTLVERCWNVKADLRPASVVVVEELRHILVSSIELEDGASVTTVSRKHLEQFN